MNDNADLRFTTEQMRIKGNILMSTVAGLELVHEDGDLRVWFDDGSQNGHPYLHCGYIERRTSDGRWITEEAFNGDNPAEYHAL